MRKGSKQSSEAKKKMSIAHSGKKLSKEHKAKLSVASKNMSAETKKKIGATSKRRWQNKSYKEKTKQAISKSLMGHSISEATKRKISISETGKTLPAEMRKALIKRNQNRRGVPLTEEHKKKISLSNMGKKLTSEQIAVMSITTRELWQNKEYRDKQLAALKRTQKQRAASVKKNWENEEYKNRVVAIMRKAMAAKPNKAELQLDTLLQELHPDQYKYVGDGQFILAGKNPDFVNVNGKKEIIELFGDYWHSKKITGKAKSEHEKDRIGLFAKYGYKTLVIWEYELKKKVELRNKIAMFVDNAASRQR